MQTGSLIIVGTGIQCAGQLTTEAVQWIQASQKVLYVITDPLSERILWNLNPNAMESMNVFYGEGKLRKYTYRQMVDHIMNYVRSGLQTCVAAYGHPGIFAKPSHEAIRRARREGYYAKMLPAVSAEDCLIADLGIDPGETGCQSFEATTLLKQRREPDTHSYVLLWQVGAIGQFVYSGQAFELSQPLQILVDYLHDFYPENHEVILYAAATEPATAHSEIRVKLSDLPKTQFNTMATLCIPPLGEPIRDREMYDKLGLPFDEEEVFPTEVSA